MAILPSWLTSYLCDFGQDIISCSQHIDMNNYLIKNVKSPVNIFDAINKADADRIKCKTATGDIPNTVVTDHTLFTFPAEKAFASGNIIICEMWDERLAGELITISRTMYATAWPGFHKFFFDLSFMTFFTGSPTSDWTRDFRLDYVKLSWVSLNIKRPIKNRRLS